MTSVLQKEPEFMPHEPVKAQEFDVTFLNEQEEKGKRIISDMARLSTPKPIMHLGSSTEFQRPSPETSGGVPRSRHSRIGSSLFKPSTGFNARHRPMTGAELPVNRPMTAVRGAGYTSSHGGKRTPFDPLHEGAQGTANISELELQKDDSPEERIRHQEGKIMQLIEEACIAQAAGENKVALTKAKEASNKERSLIRMQEQSGMGDHHNIDLTYAVLFTLANQYAANELYTEALNTYQMITKNRMFPNAYRLKVNMGNIYFKQGQYQKAVKMFRMALDQVPSSQKSLRIKIMHNIALVFIHTGQLEEALGGLEYIMSEAPSHRAGLHLVACCRATEDRERMRTAFALLLAVPLDVEDEEKYHLEQDSPEDALIATAIQNDDLHEYEMKKRQDAEYCLLTAAKLIAPFVEDNFSAGYDWCVNAIKNSEYARLAANLEINKAVMHLKEDQLNEAIQALKTYEKDSNIVVSAAVNLSFIYYLQGDYDSALKYAEIVKTVDVKDANAYVNYGACLLEKGQLEEAVSAFEKALEFDPTHFEAIYNLGLALKRAGHYNDAMDCYQRFSGSLALLPAVAYQTADTLALLGDGDAAVDAFHRLLGLTPSDAAALKKLGQLCDRLGDRRQAHHWHSESFRFYPADLSVIDWLGSYYIEMQVVEKALVYFEKAALMQPNEPRWNMMVAACHRRSGNMHKALTLYQEIHKQFPENMECLKFLVRLCSDLGMREAQDYIAELKRLEKANEIRERVGSSRPGSRKSNSGLSSRAGSGFSTVPENVAMASPRNSANRNLRSSRLIQSHNSTSSSESLYGQQTADASYSDPLGPQPTRPRTGAGRPLDFDDFANEELGDDLLPE